MSTMKKLVEAGLAFALLGACGSSATDTGGQSGFSVGAPMMPEAAAGSAAPATPPSTPPATTETPPASGSAGRPSTAPVTQPPAGTAGGPSPSPTAQPTNPGTPMLAMDECNLDTRYPGDEYCINAPPPDKGFQMHLGPSNYDNPGAQWIMQPGTETTENVSATAGNTEDVYYYWRQYRMRPGSHHLIISSGGLGGGRRLGGSSNTAKDNPEAGVIAPENQGVGMPLAARASLSNSLHYFNFTDEPIIKEVWVNFWYRDASEVTEPTREVFSMLGMGIAPGEYVNKHGACRITEPGRMLTVYGHVHSHNKRFSVWRTRGTDRMLIHEAYNWEDPNISEFSSTVMNPSLNPAAKIDGGYSGVVDLQAGDVVEFECEILNDTNSVFLGANEAEDDEMCIMIGDTVGTTISPACTATTTPVN